MKLLIVDGDDALRSLLAKELEERGIETRQSCNGDEAFYVWQQLGPWELVLSDYQFIPRAEDQGLCSTAYRDPRD